MPEFYDSCQKNYQNIRIFMIFAGQINKIREFYMIFARKMPEFYIVITRKIFFPEFWGARAFCPRFLPHVVDRILCRMLTGAGH